MSAYIDQVIILCFMHYNKWRTIGKLIIYGVESFSRGRMSSWCGTRRTLMKSSKSPCLRPTSGFLTFSSTSCMRFLSLRPFHWTECDHTDMVCICCVWPAASMWGSLQIFLTSTLHMRVWCRTTSPSRSSPPAHSTSTTSRLTSRNAASPSRAGSTPVNRHLFTEEIQNVNCLAES